MKYIAVLIVAFAFYWFYSSKDSQKPEPLLVHAPPRPGELSDVEKQYYIQVFDYVMTNLNAKDKYDWKSSDPNLGTIVVGETFISKSSSTCRAFSESYIIGDNKSTAEGIACKREGNEGWCRLKKTDAQTCAMEGSSTFGNFSFPGVNYNVSTPRVSINTGGIGSVGAPKVNGSGIDPGADNGKSDGKAGQGYADTVTGGAGSLAGPTAEKSRNLFNSTFR